MAIFQQPPTYAEPVIVDEKTGKPRFNPIWLKWFLDLAQVIDDSGGGSGTVQHNDTGGLQGGTSNEYYHLTAAQKDALLGVGGIATPSAIRITNGRMQEKQGAAVAAANDLELGTDGNYFQITGATQINLLRTLLWQGGSVVTLKFNSNPLVKHNQAPSGTFHPILLAGAVDFATSANDTLTLRYDSTDSAWYEMSRAVI